MPIFIVDIYNLGPEAMGLMVSGMGVGALGGSLFIAALGNWFRGRVLILSSFLSGLALMLVAPAALLPGGRGPDGAAGSWRRRTPLPEPVLLMEASEEEYRGRVMSIFMINFALIPLGVLPAGLAAEFLGGQMVVGILAGLLIALTTIILFTQRRLRNLR